MPVRASRTHPNFDAKQAKKIVENALLSKLQEAQAQVEQTRRLQASADERVGVLETDNAQLHSAVLSLKKQLDEANRWE